jgi:hypothetical protein
MSDPTTNDLAEYANAAPMQRPPTGRAVATTTSSSVVPIGARPVAVMRDDHRVRQKIAIEAAAAGEHWFYRFPVKSRDGTNYIEGETIKLANAVQRLYGNNNVDTQMRDDGDSWLFISTFNDYENGSSMARLYRQRKSQTSLKTRDYDRQQDIAFQIGQSKSIRNVIVNYLGEFCTFAMEQAQNSLIDKVGRDIEGWRQRTIEGLTRMPVDVKRVERVIGRSAKDWLAPDISKVIAMGKAIHEGMASIDETFPPLEAVAPPPAAQTPAQDAEGKAQPSAEQRS